MGNKKLLQHLVFAVVLNTGSWRYLYEMGVCNIGSVLAAKASLPYYKRSNYGVKLAPEDYSIFPKQRHGAHTKSFPFMSISELCVYSLSHANLVCMYLLPFFRSIAITRPQQQNQMIDSETKNTSPSPYTLLYCNAIRVTSLKHSSFHKYHFMDCFIISTQSTKFEI